MNDHAMKLLEGVQANSSNNQPRGEPQVAERVAFLAANDVVPERLLQNVFAQLTELGKGVYHLIWNMSAIAMSKALHPVSLRKAATES
jgi:hypothetical protein